MQKISFRPFIIFSSIAALAITAGIFFYWRQVTILLEQDVRSHIADTTKESARDFDRVAERFADIFAKSSTQLLIPMHCETWVNERPEFIAEVMDDMNRIMEEKGLVGRVKLLERTRWYSLDLCITEL